MPISQKALFYPALTRRLRYKINSKGNNYADYHEYYDEIQEDCQQRCVYCDIKLEEIGGEGMHLDHFRPKSNQKFQHLSNDPKNLVLSCPKCNGLKSDYWPANPNTKNTHVNGCGFIDPFVDDRNDFFEINPTGSIKDKQEPAEYMIKLLKLDRMSRIQVRRKRFLKQEVVDIISFIHTKLIELKGIADDDGISREDLSKRIKFVYDLHDMEKQLIEIL